MIYKISFRLFTLSVILLVVNIAVAQKDILVVVAHPNLADSEVNKTILQQLSKMERVTIDNIYAKYPDFQINVTNEQELLIDHDIIIFQFPLYWFSSPALLKQWQDDVITSAFSIGENNKMKGKKLMVVTSVGGTKDDYRHDGLMNVTMDEVLAPYEAFARLTEMHYLSPFVTYAVPNPTILNIPMTKEANTERRLLIESRVEELVDLLQSMD